VTGSGWRLFVRDRGLIDAAEQVCATLPSLGLKIVDASTIDDNGALIRWLDRHHVLAVLVRPDFYVFGTAGRDLAPLGRVLAERLRLNSPAEANKEAETWH